MWHLPKIIDFQRILLFYMYAFKTQTRFDFDIFPPLTITSVVRQFMKL